STPPSPMEQLTTFVPVMCRQTTWIGGLVAVLGLISLVRMPSRSLGIGTLGAFTAYLLVFFFRSNASARDPLLLRIISSYWQLPEMLICAWIGHGVRWILQSRLSWMPVIAIATICLQAGSHYQAEDRHQERFIESVANAVLKPL